MAEVATLEPEVAANSAQVAMLVCSRPPGNHCSQAASALYMRSATPLRVRISPSRMNSGMATSRNSFIVLHMVLPIMLGSTCMLIQSLTTAVMKIALATWMPAIRNRTRPPK